LRIKPTIAECLVGDRSLLVSTVSHGDAIVRFGEHIHSLHHRHDPTIGRASRPVKPSQPLNTPSYAYRPIRRHIRCGATPGRSHRFAKGPRQITAEIRRHIHQPLSAVTIQSTAGRSASVSRPAKRVSSCAKDSLGNSRVFQGYPLTPRVGWLEWRHRAESLEMSDA
jgi:hypothetical protein